MRNRLLGPISALAILVWIPCARAQLPTETPTLTPSLTPALTDTPTETPTLTPAATETPTGTATLAATPTATDTPAETPTPTVTASATLTATPFPTFTVTPVPVEVSGGQRRPLVRAQCITGGVPWPCVSGTGFGSGKVKLKRIKQNQLVANRIIGKVMISRVFPGRVQLEARVIADLSYGSDPDGDCPLAETQVLAGTVATSILSCRPGGGGSNCRGEFAVPSLVSAQCTDVNLIMENVRFEVYDVGGAGIPTALIARDGVKILGN